MLPLYTPCVEEYSPPRILQNFPRGYQGRGQRPKARTVRPHIRVWGLTVRAFGIGPARYVPSWNLSIPLGHLVLAQGIHVFPGV